MAPSGFLNSPSGDGPGDTSPATPSKMAGPQSPNSSNPGSSVETDPQQALQALSGEFMKMDNRLQELAKSYPAAAPDIRKASEQIRKVLQKIVASGNVPGQEPPAPRMVG